ncbi:MAG: dynamin family protein [Candidatus Cloacimonetes bacterium]|nr:dynamin family protein [Candidatus Cloacimonadota bacterium]
MQIKNSYLQKIDKFKKILREYNSADMFIEKAEQLETKITDFIIKVPLIGRFSAGKSRLLNTFLERNILEWSDSPTTAVATELKFAEKEKLLIHFEDNSIQEREIKSLNSLEKEIDKIKLIEIYINNKKLQQIPQIVLVDMPGIDSNNYRHTKAVANYIVNGHYFIAVATPLDAFNDRLLNQISEFANYDYDNFSFILTRKNSTPNLNETQDKLASFLKDRYKKEIFVGTTEASKLGNDIADFEKSLEIIIENQETIFLAQFQNELDCLFRDATDFISNKLKGSNLTAEQIDDTIKEIEKVIDNERGKFDTKLSEIQIDVTENAVSDIIGKTTSAIRSNSGQLANALKSGTIENQIENIIRPIIISGFKTAIQQAETKLAKKLGSVRDSIDSRMNVLLSVNVSGENGFHLKQSQEMAVKIAANQIAKPLVTSTISKAASLATKAGFASAGGFIGALAGPVGILIGVVVGELISELFLGMAEKKNIENRIQNEIIPQSIQNTVDLVKKQATEIYENIRAEYQKRFDDLEKEKLLNLNELRAEKEKSIADFEANRTLWHEALTKISEVYSE